MVVFFFNYRRLDFFFQLLQRRQYFPFFVDESTVLSLSLSRPYFSNVADSSVIKKQVAYLTILLLIVAESMLLCLDNVAQSAFL